MSDTLGSLVDKLSITNIKLWFVQDAVHAAAHSKEGLDPETVAKLHNLNLQRNKLMTEIDQTLDRAARDGEAEVDTRIKLT
jgi:hypothetical protein